MDSRGVEVQFLIPKQSEARMVLEQTQQITGKALIYTVRRQYSYYST